MVELQEEDVLTKVVVKFNVVKLYLACCSKSLRTESGTLPKGAPEGLGDIQILAKSAFNSWSFSEKQGCPNLVPLRSGRGGFGYLPSARFAAIRSLLKFIKGISYTRVEGQHSWWTRRSQLLDGHLVIDTYDSSSRSGDWVPRIR